MRRLTLLAVLVLLVLAISAPRQTTHVTPVSVPVPAPQLPTWTPPYWNPQPSARVVHRSICFSPDIAPIDHVECWPVDANSYPYGPYYVPAAI